MTIFEFIYMGIVGLFFYYTVFPLIEEKIYKHGNLATVVFIIGISQLPLLLVRMMMIMENIANSIHKGRKIVLDFELFIPFVIFAATVLIFIILSLVHKARSANASKEQQNE